jgi:glycosyltransferase involved in cell wall biosynthesis
MNLYLKSPGARRILPITKAMRNWLASTYDVSLESPFCVISPMGVDLEQFENLPDPKSARKQLDLEEGLTVGYAGHLYEGRGLPLMVDLAKRNPELQFLWIGGEPQAVKNWQQHLNTIAVNNVKLVGFVPNERLPLYQAACDILLMPYERQIAGSSGGDTAQFASPMKVFEYLATGRAILASDLGVLREVLDEDIAILISPEDVDAWDAAMTLLLNDAEQRDKLSAKARRKATEFSWKKRAERSLQGLIHG